MYPGLDTKMSIMSTVYKDIHKLSLLGEQYELVILWKTKKLE